MSPQAAQLVYLSVMAVGLAIWLWSLILALRLGRSGGGDGGWAERRFTSPDLDPSGPVESGERVVRGDPEKLSKEIVRAFIQGHLGTTLFEVVERSPRRVALQKTGPLVTNQPAGLYFSELEIELEPLGGDEVRARYTLGFGRLARRMRAIALAIICGVGLPVLLAAGAVVWIFVVRSESEIARWQVLQLLHIGHALWPPFLLLWLPRVGRRQSKTFVSNLLATLEHVD